RSCSRDPRALFPQPARGRIVLRLAGGSTGRAFLIITAALAFDRSRAREIDRRLRAALRRDGEELLGDSRPDTDHTRIVVAEPAADETGMQAIRGHAGAGKPPRQLAREQD